MPDTTIIPFELPLPQVLPTIEGNVDYRQFRDQLLRIDELLRLSGLESLLIRKDLQRWLARCKKPSTKAQQNRQLHCGRALRCNIARVLLQEEYRGFAARLADSPLLQYFCGLSEVACVTVPSKSTLQRYDQWWPQTEVRQVIQQLVGLAGTDPKKLDLSEAVDLESAFLDSTCLSANIHYPVDWVLLRDSTRTLMKAVRLIRDQGIKHRMPAPESFLSRINKLCIQMTHAGNKDDSQRHRKKTLRQMDKLVCTVRDHAKRYRQLLAQCWPQTQWTQAQAEQVLGRMGQVLEQLPQARKQARQRILQGQAVPNEEKILSLYEPDVHVIVRKKAGAEVEFGNTLFLAENPQGLILDWELFQQSAPADSALMPRSVGRMEKVYGPLKAVGADRGFDSEMNRVGLAEDGIYNGVCPRSPQLLEQRNHSWKFKWLQRRRAQIEARVSIIKNVFLRGRVRSKGFAHRQLAVTWSVLVHNLWVLARLPQPEAAEAARAA
ncbi:MAG TPA: transposase [Verrucomicrobiae bacterium]|nr:transposase [Verrucomicrobiae bacterium]